MFSFNVLLSFQQYKALYIIQMNVSRNMLNHSMKKGQFVSYNRMHPPCFTKKTESFTLITFMYIIIYIYKWEEEEGQYEEVQECLNILSYLS
jgi:hypothetical protein